VPPGLRSRTVRVEPFASTGKSGSQMERWWLDDGRSVVAKHVDARDDWIMQATGDDGRVVALWAEGFFQRLPPEIAHGILEVATSERGSILVMEDLTGSVFADPAALVPAQRAVLRAAAGIHGSSREPPTTASARSPTTTASSRRSSPRATPSTTRFRASPSRGGDGSPTSSRMT